MQVDSLVIVSRSTPLPFQLDEENVDETLRLRYRWLDLRRDKLQRNIALRAQMVGIIRRGMEHAGFLDIQTPILFKPTPEGARDFVVPSRLQQGRFFALPQSPQILKQLTMIAGFDRYYQIAICFRDEDLRADRVQEITQLDVEMSFPDREELFALMEETFAAIWRECLGIEIAFPFPRMTFAEADRRFGTDKPDTRFALEIEDATGLTRESEFGVFAGAEAVRFLRVPRPFSRSELGSLEELAKEWGAKGLAYLVGDEGTGEVRSPIAKFLSERELDALAVRPGETLLFAADAWASTSNVLGRLRLHLGRELGLVDETVFTFLWVTDFPMFEWDDDEGRWGAVHHPFTRPTAEWKDGFADEPGAALADAYDLIVNGNELGGGSFRIHEPDLQARVFDLLRTERGGAAREVRLPARRARDGCAAARRHRARHRPHDDGARRRAEPPRRDRVPEEPGRARPDERRTVRGHARAAGRARHQARAGGARLTSAIAQRLLWLAAIAVLGGLLALVLVEATSGDSTPAAAPTGAVAAGGGWYEALAGSRGQAGDAEKTSCGLVLTEASLGVTHPVLPCGAKVLLRFGGQVLFTEVIDNNLKSSGRQLEVTEGLAQQLGLDGTQKVDWRFAAAP